MRLTDSAATRFLRWRVPPNCVLPLIYQELSRALEHLNVRVRTAALLTTLSWADVQASGDRPVRWQARCRAYNHAAPPAGLAKDAFLVSLDAGSTSPGYVVLRRALGPVICARLVTHY